MTAHRVAEQMCKNLMNQWQHLQRVVDHFTTEQSANNRLQLKALVFIVWHLAFQAIAFRGRDESFSSSNLENFLESLGIVTFWNEKVVEVIEKAPKNATYISPRIQMEILHIFSTKVKKGHSGRNWWCKVLHNGWWSSWWFHERANGYGF